MKVFADAALIHRAVSDLLDNELKHLPAACTIMIYLQTEKGFATLMLEDDGPGFGEEVGSEMFQQRVKGKYSSGHGLGLAFVEAVARAHGGTVSASNRSDGGARLVMTLPCRDCPQERPENPLAVVVG